MWGMRDAPHSDDEEPLALVENRARPMQGGADGRRYKLVSDNEQTIRNTNGVRMDIPYHATANSTIDK